MTKKYPVLQLFLLLFPLLAMVNKVDASPQDSMATGCPYVKITPQRLPDLNIPRFSHRVCYVNGELTLFGGHTSGFVLTPTAEYYKDGEWHLMKMVYNHDDGICVPLRSGKVFLAGGYEKNLGIGQTYEAEMYNPATHTFEGFGCLDRRRAHGVGIEADSGKVYISGNWYHKDGIELYEGKINFTFIKETSEQRSLPFLFRMSDGDVMVVNDCHDNYGNPLLGNVVDRAKGESFNVPLLETWHPYLIHQGFVSEVSFMGDEQKGEFAYLLPLKNAEGQVAIAEVRDTVFSLLPTDYPIPTKYKSYEIIYSTPVVVDREIQRGYVMGYDTLAYHRYILTIDYAKRPASIKLYYTDPMADTQCCTPWVMPNGDLVTTGGVGGKNSNFDPVASVWLFPFGRSEVASQSAVPLWEWIMLALLIVAFLAYIIINRCRKKVSQADALTEEDIEEPLPNAKREELMSRLTELLEKEKLYLDSDLNMSDVANRLCVHRNDVSMVVNSSKGISFSQLVNGYRVEYAKQQLLLHPTMKMANVAISSGFSSDTSFYRTFKAITGMTPSEWLSQQK